MTDQLANESNNDPNQTKDVHQAALEAVQLYEQTKSAEPATTDSKVFDESMELHLHFEDHAEPAILTLNEEIIAGRSDDRGIFVAGLDLTPYGAYQNGVSRKHALLRRNDNRLEVMDMGSRNGVFVNEVKLQSEEPYTLTNGDVLRLSKMMIRVEFAKKSD